MIPVRVFLVPTNRGNRVRKHDGVETAAVRSRARCWVVDEEASAGRGSTMAPAARRIARPRTMSGCLREGPTVFTPKVREVHTRRRSPLGRSRFLTCSLLCGHSVLRYL